MIIEPTVLILGAGTSAPYGFPLGRELLFNVATKLAGESEAPQALLPWFDKYNGSIGFKEFARLLLHSNQPSVDIFLESRPEYLDLGKASMAACLIPHEELDKLLEHRREIKWYEYLRQQLGARQDEIEDNKLSIITFNYDRSLEYCLFNAFRASYNLSDDEAAKLLSAIPIVHVYGQLGKPHWAQENSRGYLPKTTAEEISICVSEMKILSEGSETSPEFEQARKLIGEARKIFILGFGYHKVNIRRLGLHTLLNHNPPIWGTTYKLMPAERDRARKRFAEQANLNFDLPGEDKKVLEFIRTYPLFN